MMTSRIITPSVSKVSELALLLRLVGLEDLEEHFLGTRAEQQLVILHI